MLLFDFSALGSVTLVSIDIIDVERDQGEFPATVQMFDGMGMLLNEVILPATGDNGVGRAVSLGPTAGVVMMKVNLDGSGAIDEIVFSTTTDNPCIDLEKEISVDGGMTFVDADDAASAPTTTVGGGAEYRLIAANCGDVDLTDVVINDATLGIANFSVGSLAVGQQIILDSGDIPALEQPNRCSTPGNVTNTAMVSGNSVTTGAQVSDQDPAVLRCLADNPCIDLEKEVSVDGGANFFDADDSTSAPSTTVGGGALYQLIAVNCGDVDLENVVINDVTLGITDFPVGFLAVGEQVILDSGDIPALNQPNRCATPGDVTNTASVTGQSVSTGEEVDDSDPAVVTCVADNPCIDLEKEISVDGGVTFVDADDLASAASASAGSGALYRLIVFNCGDVALQNVVINDAILGISNFPVGSLAVGQEVVLGSGQIPALDQPGQCAFPGQVTNTASASGSSVTTGQPVNDSDPAVLVCEDQPCELSVTKTCLVPTPPQPSVCKGKVTAMTFIYTGESCTATTNQQEGKVLCSGDPMGAQPVSLVVTKDTSKFMVTPSGSTINVGDVVSIRKVDGSEFSSDTPMEIRQGSTVRQSLSIHTSCSKPLNVGDQFGGLRLIEFTSKDGGTVTLPSPPVPTSECEISSVAPPHCQGKVQTLTLRYTGGDCTITNTQSGKAVCTGNAGVAQPVQIVITKDAGKFAVNPSTQSISLGSLVAIASTGSALPSETKFDVRQGGATIASLTIHTSCSQPLNLGDRFGPFEVVSLNTTNGGVISNGAQVEYAYQISNMGSADIQNLAVVDNVLGPVPGNPGSLGAGQMVTLTASSFVSQDTTNTVIVTGDTAAGSVCTASDTATVMVVPPPGPPFVCKDAKPIDGLTMFWAGSDPIRIKAWKGAVGSTLLADIDNIMPGEEVTVDGFAGSPNDVIWEIFAAGTSTKLGESTFHLSCSDEDMNGPEDCGKREGDGKARAGFINTWVFEGIRGQNNISLTCTP